MSFVRSLTCYDHVGNITSFDQLDDIVWFELEFRCPSCETEQETTGTFDKSAQHTCATCKTQYHLLPLVANDGTSVDTLGAREQVEEQLYAVSVAEELVSRDPRLAFRICGLPSTVLYGFPPAVLGIVSITGLGVAVQTGFSTSIALTVVYALTVLAFTTGLAFVLFDAYGALLRINEYRTEAGVDISTSVFIRCVGNHMRYPSFRYATRWWRGDVGWTSTGRGR